MDDAEEPYTGNDTDPDSDEPDETGWIALDPPTLDACAALV